MYNLIRLLIFLIDIIVDLDYINVIVSYLEKVLVKKGKMFFKNKFFF